VAELTVTKYSPKEDMKTLARFVRTTILGGVFFLIPIVVLIIILAKTLDYANKALQALSSTYPPRRSWARRR
jgi:hypothetical protein